MSQPHCLSPLTWRRSLVIPTLLWLAVATAAAVGAEVIAVGALPEGRETARPELSADDLAWARRALADYRAVYGMLPAAGDGELRPRVGSASLLAHRYPLLPMAGIYNEEIWGRNFVDLDPSDAILDFGCSVYTYDGHLGHDYMILGFAHQAVGVPVFAPLPGRVVGARDGLPDHETNCGNFVANSVIVDHGGGQVVYYWHLKKGSVRVGTGDLVQAGQELGRVGSSGCSTWPHLHFETHVDGEPIEPSTGSCNPGTSGWKRQKRLFRRARVLDAGFTDRHPSTLAGDERPPYRFPASGQAAVTDGELYLWLLVINVDPHTEAKLEAYGPEGGLHYSAGPEPLGVPRLHRTEAFFLPIDTSILAGRAGTWTVVLELDGKVEMEAPLEVRARRKRSLNRAPLALDKVVLRPRKPRAGMPVECRAIGPRLVADPDYDVVRYRYVWRVNGAVARKTTTAVRSDLLPGVFERGDEISCAVTPGDGRLAAPTVSRKRTAR